MLPAVNLHCLQIQLLSFSFLMLSELPKLYGVLAVLRAIGPMVKIFFPFYIYFYKLNYETAYLFSIEIYK